MKGTMEQKRVLAGERHEPMFVEQSARLCAVCGLPDHMHRVQASGYEVIIFGNFEGTVPANPCFTVENEGNRY
jgi:hypothetical protein